MTANNEVVLRDSSGEWLYFRSPQKVLCARSRQDVAAVLDEASKWRGWSAGYVSYEAAPAFDSSLPAKESDIPLVWFGLFDAPEKVTLPADVSVKSCDWKFDVDKSVYALRIRKIKDYIREGETYQVNYTVRLNAEVSDAWRFFLGNMSQAEFSAFIQTDELSVCSSSPELFFELDGHSITCCPMKGTARNSDFLAESVKDKAENIMIVDMMRNDLGHICEPGSIIADPLFSVQPYERIWQMTSTVKGETSASIPEIFAALFPCASITGAPKRRTMQIIDELEDSPRGVYCGAIGYIAPERKSRFSVAIRTAQVKHTTREAVYGVGGGIVWDSQVESEWDECALKAEILGAVVERASSDLSEGLVNMPDDFQLLETMLYDNGIAYLEEHIDRLAHSAQELGFQLNLLELKTKLYAIDGERQRLRLLLNRDGEISLESYPFPEQKEPVRTLAFSKEPVDSDNPFLYHKTTRREIYNNARASVPTADDVILWNERGEVTESTIANIVVEIDGKLCTPPVKCGLLPGTMRAALLKKGEISERIVTIDDLRNSPRIFLVNSLRGWMPAEIDVSSNPRLPAGG